MNLYSYTKIITTTLLACSQLLHSMQTVTFRQKTALMPTTHQTKDEIIKAAALKRKNSRNFYADDVTINIAPERMPLLQKAPPVQKMTGTTKLPPITDARDYWPKEILSIVGDYVGEEEWVPVRVLDHNSIVPSQVHVAWFNQPDEKTITTVSNKATDLPSFYNGRDQYNHRTIWDVKTGKKIKNFVTSVDFTFLRGSNRYEQRSTEKARNEATRAQIAIEALQSALLNNNKQQMIAALKNGTAVVWKKLSATKEYLNKRAMPAIALNLTPDALDKHECNSFCCSLSQIMCKIIPIAPCVLLSVPIEIGHDCCFDGYFRDAYTQPFLERYFILLDRLCNKLCYTTGDEPGQSAEESIRQATQKEQAEERLFLRQVRLDLLLNHSNGH